MDPIAKINEAMRRVNSKYSDEADGIFSLVRKFFDSGPQACETCPYFLELSETCEALEDGAAELCPALEDLVQDQMHAMQDEHMSEGDYR
jgi:hypothetical protein